MVTSQVIIGNNHDNHLNSGAGDDQVFGKGGDDTIRGDATGNVTVALNVDVALEGGKSADAVSLTIGKIPVGATLSAGKLNADGTWTLSKADLVGLTLTLKDAINFTLSVHAVSTDGSNKSADGTIDVTLQHGNNDLLVGGRGNDLIIGNGGDDLIYGGGIPTGQNHISTAADNDVIHAGEGNDKAYGQAGDDKIFGDAGNDFLSGGKGNDFVYGGTGDDIVYGNTGDDQLFGDFGNDLIYGGIGNDVISDGNGNDKVYGGSGNDTFVDGAGSDYFSGGSGFDTLDFSGAKRGVKVDMASKSAEGMGHDTFSSIENVIGSNFGDSFRGDKHASTFTGGKGNDVYVWAQSAVNKNGLDHITDFAKGDSLNLRELLKGQKFADAVKVTDTAAGSTVSVKFGGSFHDVVVLDGVHGMNASELLKAGMILV